MRNVACSTLAAATFVSLGAAYAAEAMTQPQYQAAKRAIAADHRRAKAECKSLAGNARDVCMVEAKGREKVSIAELEARFAPTPRTAYDVRIARANAQYAVAKERCDDLAGNGKDVCRKEAIAARTTARTDAETSLKTTNARDEADKKVSVARKDAMDEKLDAEYGVAKEKCAGLAGPAKDQCITAARARFGKS